MPRLNSWLVFFLEGRQRSKFFIFKKNFGGIDYLKIYLYV
jgi:hypothetical protein